MNSIKRMLEIAALLLLMTGQLQGQNPIVPAGVYIADPSAHVWPDGNLYIYGSRDESPYYYCSRRYDVLSTSDLKTWTNTPNVFASKGTGDQVTYSDDLLFAPDCQYRNGAYYLYYCLASNRQTEGVATSTSPTGPFLNGQNIELKGINEIDPCVFMDDDGHAYYIWGQFMAKIAMLRTNMTEIDPNTIQEGVVTEKNHFFHEGGYMVKRKGIYYFVDTHMGRAGMPTCIGYATSNSPLGPFTYRGVIIDNDHCDPGNWNNHGSLVEFKEQWYVFYHRATHGCRTMRKACLEPIYFNPDGSINEVEMTTQGAAAPLNPLARMEASRACLLYGNLRVKAIGAENEALAEIKNNDQAAYKYFDFNSGVQGFTIHVAPGTNSGRIDVLTDDAWGPTIGSVEVPGDGNGKTWIDLSCKVSNITGVHAVWLTFQGKGDELFKVDWFQFRRD